MPGASKKRQRSTAMLCVCTPPVAMHGAGCPTSRPARSAMKTHTRCKLNCNAVGSVGPAPSSYYVLHGAPPSDANDRANVIRSSPGAVPGWTQVLPPSSER